MSKKSNDRITSKDRRIQPLSERTKDMSFRIDMTEKNQMLYYGMALAGALVYLAGVGLYIYRMFTMHLGDLRYAVMVVGVALGANIVLGFVNVFRQKIQKLEVFTADQISKGCDRVTNMGMAAGQIFLAVFLMELLSKSSLPRWIPSMTAIGALLCYCGGKMICEAVKEIKK